MRCIKTLIERRDWKTDLGDIFSVEIKVWFRDIDVLGHVNNATYFTYMETARIEYLSNLLGIKSPSEMRIIVARASCNFRSPASFGETLVVSCKPFKVGNRSWTYVYEIREKESGRLVADGETVQVMYDYRKRKSTQIPDYLRSKLMKLAKTK